MNFGSAASELVTVGTLYSLMRFVAADFGYDSGTFGSFDDSACFGYSSESGQTSDDFGKCWAAPLNVVHIQNEETKKLA